MNEPIYQFQERLEFSNSNRSKATEAIIMEILVGCVSVERANLQDDRSGIDYWATLRGGGACRYRSEIARWSNCKILEKPRTRIGFGDLERAAIREKRRQGRLDLRREQTDGLHLAHF